MCYHTNKFVQNLSWSDREGSYIFDYIKIYLEIQCRSLNYNHLFIPLYNIYIVTLHFPFVTESVDPTEQRNLASWVLSFFRRRTYLRTFAALSHQFHICFVLFASRRFSASISYHEFCRIIWLLSTFCVVSPNHRWREKTGPRRGIMEDGSIGPPSIL